VLLIDSPLAGTWDVELGFGHSWKRMNLPAPSELNLEVTVVGADAITVSLRGLRPGQRRDLRTAARERNTDAAISAALDIP
jgi:hypothetical protein